MQQAIQGDLNIAITGRWSLKSPIHPPGLAIWIVFHPKYHPKFQPGSGARLRWDDVHIRDIERTTRSILKMSIFLALVWTTDECSYKSKQFYIQA